MHMHLPIHTYVSICMIVHISWIYTYAYLYVYVYVYEHVCINVYLYALIYIYIATRKHTNTCTFGRQYHAGCEECIGNQCKHILYMYTYLYTHICIYVYICIHIYIHLNICIHTYSYMYIYIYVWNTRKICRNRFPQILVISMFHFSGTPTRLRTVTLSFFRSLSHARANASLFPTHAHAHKEETVTRYQGYTQRRARYRV